jgi:hypothetical protein
MINPQSYWRFRDAYSNVTRDYAMEAQEEQSSYCADLEQIGANAENELRRIHDNYLQELQGAWAGDDAIQRASLAYRNLQREYYRIQAEYLKASRLRHGRMIDTLSTLTSKASVKTLDSWIEYLKELKHDSAQTGESKPTGKKEVS